MPRKQVSVDRKVYDRLLKMKAVSPISERKESFSEVIERLIEVKAR